MSATIENTTSQADSAGRPRRQSLDDVGGRLRKTIEKIQRQEEKRGSVRSTHGNHGESVSQMFLSAGGNAYLIEVPLCESRSVPTFDEFDSPTEANSICIRQMGAKGMRYEISLGLKGDIENISLGDGRYLVPTDRRPRAHIRKICEEVCAQLSAYAEASIDLKKSKLPKRPR